MKVIPMDELLQQTNPSKEILEFKIKDLEIKVEYGENLIDKKLNKIAELNIDITSIQLGIGMLYKEIKHLKEHLDGTNDCQKLETEAIS